MGDLEPHKNLNDDQPNEPEIELELEELREGMREINVTLTHILNTLEEIRDRSFN